MSSEQNKTIVRRLLEEPWTGNLKVVDELIDRNYVGYDPSIPEPRRGPDGFKENVSTYREAYSDARITVDEQIAEGDRVATRWTGRGKHDGGLMGVAPTGKQVKVSGLTLSRLANGKVIEEYTNWDTFGMMQQLGIVPELPTPNPRPRYCPSRGPPSGGPCCSWCPDGRFGTKGRVAVPPESDTVSLFPQIATGAEGSGDVDGPDGGVP